MFEFGVNHCCTFLSLLQSVIGTVCGDNLVLRHSHAPRGLVTGLEEKRMPNGTWLGLRGFCDRPNDPGSDSDYANYEARCVTEEPEFPIRFRSIVKLTTIPARDGEGSRLDGWVLAPGQTLSLKHRLSYEGLMCVGTVYSINGVWSSPIDCGNCTADSTPKTFTGIATASPDEDKQRIDYDISRPADQTAAYGVRNHKKLLLAYLMQLFTTDLMVQTNFNFDHVFLCSIFFKSFFYYLGHILGEKKSAQILILSTPIDRKTMFPVDWCIQIIFLLKF
jgi:hypothetical protein